MRDCPSPWTVRAPSGSRAVFPALVALAVFSTSRAAFAREPYDPLLAGEAMGGVGTPVGFAGVGLAAFPVKWVGIAAGVGGGVFGVEGALALRARLIARKMAFGAAVGASMGPYGASAHPTLEDGPTYKKSYEYVTWLTTELFIERHGDGHLGWRIFFGGSHPLAIGPASCTDTMLDRDVSACRTWKPVTFLPYLGASLEWF